MNSAFMLSGKHFTNELSSQFPEKPLRTQGSFQLRVQRLSMRTQENFVAEARG